MAAIHRWSALCLLALGFTRSAYAGAPAVTTSAATMVTSSSALLNGSGNPNGESTTGWFRVSTTSPGTCNDSFGVRVPAAGGTDLGTGIAGLGYSITATGLLPGTTYYFCAIVSNATGTALGVVLSFVTSARPAVTTHIATSVTATSATLNGSAVPNLAATTSWFRYSTTNPGTCSDTFGTRAPASSGSTLGAGNVSVSFSQGLTSLSPGTTYYYCALASNSVGTSAGAVLSFTTPAPVVPVVTTLAATPVTATNATLNATVNPGGTSTTGWYRYAAVDPGTCDDTFGTRAPASGGSALGAGSSLVALIVSVTGLSPATTYYFCAIASNSAGTSFGAVLSFTTPPAPPAVATSGATAVASGSATLNGSAVPDGADSTGWFRYALASPGTCNDSFGTRTPASGGTSLGAGNASTPFSQVVTGLLPATTYYFCALASNSLGTSSGAVLSFTTLAAPTVTTAAATAVASAGATLNGSAVPGGASTTGWFRYALTSPGTCTDTFGTRAPSMGGTSLGAGNTSAPFSQVVTGLSPATTYYFCAIASNSVGTALGAVLSFTTPAQAPTVTTAAATAVASDAATLNGFANPGGAATTGFFRYDTVDPGTCNDAFGARAPSSGGTSLGTGISTVPFSETVTGLSPGRTYYYCAIATSSVATSTSEVRTFTTAAAPAVTTEAATSVSSASAALNGTAVPNRAEATGWFRFASTDPGVCNDSFGTRAPASGGTALGAGTAAVPFSVDVSGFVPATTYYYCAIAENAAGKRFGAIRTVTASAARPAVTTAAATGVTNDSAVLNGSAVPNGDATTGWYRYAMVDPGTCDDGFGTRTPSIGGADLGAGTQAVAFSTSLGGLTRGATYYYCAIAINALGKSFGAIQSVVPGSTSPIVTTEGVSAVSGSGATLAGTANPNGSSASGWFRVGPVAPSPCDDSFGSRAPASGGTPLGAGAAPVPFETPITDLEPNLTYYYCAAAVNAGGATFGEVRSFTTHPLPPVITTVAATVAADGTVTLEGLANPRGAETTTWFRFGTSAPASCDDTFGTRWPETGGTAVGAGRANVDYSEVVAGLPPGKYSACALGSNDGGQGAGELVTFEIRSASKGGGGGGCGTASGSGAVASVLASIGLLLLRAPRRRRRS